MDVGGPIVFDLDAAATVGLVLTGDMDAIAVMGRDGCACAAFFAAAMRSFSADLAPLVRLAVEAEKFGRVAAFGLCGSLSSAVFILLSSNEFIILYIVSLGSL